VVAVTPIVVAVAASATMAVVASATMPTGAAIGVAALTAGMPRHIVLTDMVAGAVGSIATL
jgi:hypothetical protein